MLNFRSCPTQIRDLKMKHQFSSLGRVMESETISKNGDSPKSQRVGKT